MGTSLGSLVPRQLSTGEEAASTGQPSGSYGQCWAAPGPVHDCEIEGCGSQPDSEGFSVATALGKNESGQGEGILFLLRPCLCAPVPSVTRLVLEVTPGASFLGVHKNVPQKQETCTAGSPAHQARAGPAGSVCIHVVPSAHVLIPSLKAGHWGSGRVRPIPKVT